MNVLWAAIYNHFKSDVLDAFYVGVGGRFYFNEAPQGTTFPFCVFSQVDGEVEFDFGTSADRLEDIRMQFSIFSESESAVEIGNLFENLKAMFDDNILTVSGYENILFERDQTVGPIGKRSADGNKIWQINIDYNINLEKK